MQTPSTPLKPSAAALVTLIVSAAANAALAVYQWRELFNIRTGGTAACSINETVNCATVWSSPFASKMHEWFGMPVAGLGLVWALTAVVLAGVLAWRSGAGRDLTPALGAVKLAALVGVCAVLTFASASFAAKAVCLTCLGTYALVTVYAIGAFVLLPGPRFITERLGASVAWAVVIAAPIFLALLVPGQRTPKAVEAKIEATTESSDAELVRYLETMPEGAKQATSSSFQRWQSSQRPGDLGDVTPRAQLGSADAPMKVVDFTDILCGHCKQLELTLGELRRVLPEGRMSIEARHFPLDGECNAKIPKVWGDGIRCLAAKVQVCLEGDAALWPVKHELFERQETLSKELILEVATKHSGQSREALLSCVALPETQSKIDADIEYATKYGISGTPLILVNGKEGTPIGPFLLAMAIYRADPNAPYFKTLPPPEPAP